MAANSNVSVVEYFSENERYRCGYCGCADTNYSHGMWAHSMTVQDYQDLLDRGWRRSGKYCYKPTMKQTCCPLYTIRCEVLNFKLRKSQKKVLKKVNKYLIEGIKPTSDKDDDNTLGDQDDFVDGENQSEQNPGTQAANLDQEHIAEDLSGSEKEHKVPRKGTGPDPTKPPCKKAKELRRERKLAKMASKIDSTSASETAGVSSIKGKQAGKTLEDYISEPSKAAKCAHKLEIRTVRSNPRSEEFESSLKESHQVYQKYQIAIHKDEPSKPDLHQYARFLVDSPLEADHPGGTLRKGYGSFHQQYILDGKIICVGVIDILPSLVSSKYLYYDPDYAFLSLGTYSALREIAFVRELHRQSKAMLYYYMGFYIHSCPKMRYKGGYYPSYLACPETYDFYPVEKCAPMLDEKKYCRFSDSDKKDKNGVVDLENVMVLFQRQAMPYTVYKALSMRKSTDTADVTEYAGFVGKKCAERMLLFRK